MVGMSTNGKVIYNNNKNPEAEMECLGDLLPKCHLT